MDMVIALLCLAFGGALGWFIAQARAAATNERARLLALDLEAARQRLTDLESQSRKLKMNSPPSGQRRSKKLARSPMPMSA